MLPVYHNPQLSQVYYYSQPWNNNLTRWSSMPLYSPSVCYVQVPVTPINTPQMYPQMTHPTFSPFSAPVPEQQSFNMAVPSYQPSTSHLSYDSGVDFNVTDSTLGNDISLNMTSCSDKDTDPRGDLSFDNKAEEKADLDQAFHVHDADSSDIDVTCDSCNCEGCEEKELLDILTSIGCPKDLDKRRSYSI